MKVVRVVCGAALVAGSLFVVKPGVAQQALLPSGPERGVELEVMHPDFKGFDVTIPSTVWHLSGRLPVHERIRIIADIPFAYAKFKDEDVEGFGSNTVLGNPLLGVEVLGPRGLRFELSGRAPLTTADEDSFADVIGALADLQRAESFMMDAVPVSAILTVERAVRPGLELRARAGATTIFDTSDYEEAESSLTSLDYAIFGSYSAGIARFGTGLSGRWDASADEGNFGERSVHQLGLTADVNLGRVRPGLAVRVPLDKDYREFLSSSIGFYIQAPLP